MRLIAFATVRPSMLAFRLVGPFKPAFERAITLASKPISSVSVIVVIASFVVELIKLPLVAEKVEMYLILAFKSLADRQQKAMLMTI